MSESNRWEVMSYGQLSAFDGVGGGLFHFRFRNMQNEKVKDFAALAGGIGLGASIPGPSAAVQTVNQALNVWGMTGHQLLNAFIQNNAHSPYNELNCVRRFAFHDLHFAYCEMASGFAGVLAGMSLGAMRIQRSPNAWSERLVGFTGSGGPAVDVAPNAYLAGGILLPIQSWGRDFQRLDARLQPHIARMLRAEGQGAQFRPSRSTL